MTLFEEGLEAFMVTALCLVPVAVGLKRFGVLDHPTSRSLHERATPRGAGIAVAVGALVTISTSNNFESATRAGVLVAAAGLGLIGLAEDIKGVSAVARLIAQAVIAVLALPWLLDGLGKGALSTVLIALATAVWIVGFANAYNFMDGINGIAAAQVLVAAVTWTIIADGQGARATASGAVIIGAVALAFTPVNFPRARVFLGDVGSYFTGTWLAVLVVLGMREGLPPEAMLAPTVIFVVDTFVTFIRRWMHGEPVLEPHREHKYQQLVAGGWSHAATTLFVAALAALCSLLGAVSVSGGTAARVAADVGIVVIVIGYLLTPSRSRMQA